MRLMQWGITYDWHGLQSSSEELCVMRIDAPDPMSAIACRLIILAWRVSLGQRPQVLLPKAGSIGPYRYRPFLGY